MEHIRELDLGPNGQYFYTYADNYLEKHANHQSMDVTLDHFCDFLDNYNADGTYIVESYLNDHLYIFFISFEGEIPFSYAITNLPELMEV